MAPKQGRSPDVVVSMPTQESARDTLRRFLTDVDGLSEDDRAEVLELEQRLGGRAGDEVDVDWNATATARATIDPQLAQAIVLLSVP